MTATTNKELDQNLPYFNEPYTLNHVTAFLTESIYTSVLFKH